jgi:putative RNA 2'-phosphotransferase
LYLRHEPEKIGLKLDNADWADVDEILAALRITRAELEEVVATNDKQHFAFSGDGGRIRASQGHTVPVELDLPTRTPPAVLYHGTVAKFLDAIRCDGLRPMSRHHVHLSATIETAEKVGARRGKPVILAVDAAALPTARCPHPHDSSTPSRFPFVPAPPGQIGSTRGAPPGSCRFVYLLLSGRYLACFGAPAWSCPTTTFLRCAWF